jgi:hypothetical protein
LEEQEKEVVSKLEEVCFELGEVFDHSSEVEGSYGLVEWEGLSHNRS